MNYGACPKTQYPRPCSLFFRLGFTLIELLVTISIVGIIFALGVAQYNKFNRRQILIQAAQELKSNLRLAQDKALAGEKDCSVCQGSDGVCGNADDRVLEGWYASFSSDSYQIYGRCGGQTFGTKSVNLSNRGVTLPSPPPVVRFKPLGQGVEGATTVGLSGFGPTQTVTVTETGEIR